MMNPIVRFLSECKITRLWMVFFYLACARWVFILFTHAWVTEDAFVTFRVIDNFIHGYGLRWNIDERVQAYTNPLWMLIHIPFYAFLHNIAFITKWLSFVCAISSTVLVLRTFRPNYAVATLFFLLPLIYSKTLAIYFSSGLENPLTSLLFAWFGYELWRHIYLPRWFWLSLIVGLAMLNRLDTVIVYIPVLLYLVWVNRFHIGLSQIMQSLAGAMPILCWFAFSLFYYGFLLPNTKYAKLNTGVPESQYLHLGLNYTMEFALSDPVMAFLIIATAACAALLYHPRFPAPPLNMRNGAMLMIALGMVLYCVYAAMVGGSFMTLRFSSLPAFISVWLLIAQVPKEASNRLLLAGAVLFFAIDSLAKLEVVHQMQDNYRTIGKIFESDGKFTRLPLVYRPEPKRKWCNPDDPIKVKFAWGVGRGLFYYDPACTHYVDGWALAEALLARLPATYPLDEAGHAGRTAPYGYLHALKTGSLERMPPPLAQYYKHLRLIITGDLWDLKRLQTIILFNQGKYDHWRTRYLNSIARK